MLLPEMKVECSFSVLPSVFLFSACFYISLTEINEEKKGRGMNGTRNKMSQASPAPLVKNKEFLKNLTPCIQGVIL